MKGMMIRMVYLFLADGFEITEAMAPMDLLTRAGVKVTTVGIGTLWPESSAGIKVQAMRTDEDFLLPDDAEMVVLPGGMPGTTNLMESQVVKETLAAAKERNLLIGAICAAPWILDANGLLKDKIATMYPTMHANMKEGSYTGEPVVADGKIITARAAGCAMLFGLTLVSHLRGSAVAAQVKHSIYPNW